MANVNETSAKILQFPEGKKEKSRKTGLNANKEGSVRKINGKVAAFS